MTLAATAVALAGCGGGSSSSSGSPSSSGSALGLDSVTISGDVGSAPKVDFTGKVTDPNSVTKVLVTGTGPKIQQGDSLIVQTVIADGATQKTVASSYQDQQPQVVTLSSQVSPIFLDALEGKKIGSRVVVYDTADKIFGSAGNASLNISPTDVVMIVFDLIGQPLDKPNGASHAAPSWAPSIQRTKGVISGFGFNKTPKPDGSLKSANLRSGTGPVVKKGQTIFVRYLGQVYQGKKPFDQNFSGDPVGFPIGVANVITGWDKTLVGQHVGSEVVLEIPPKDGYGKAGSSQAHIKGTDTLYFVVDIVGAA
ncbi:MAG: FKBP-type peptidyl-prolyl cis-trans isomerase [Nocardioides sp.]